MPLIPAICSQCGQAIKVDTALKSMKCEYCGTEFIPEQIIHNNIYQVNGDNITIAGGLTPDQLCHNADTFFNVHGDYKKALELYKKVSNDAPHDFRGWLGIARIKTKDFTEFFDNKKDFDETKEYLRRALNVADNSNKATIQHFIDLTENAYSDTRNKYQAQVNVNLQEISKISKELETHKKQAKNYESKISTLKNNANHSEKIMTNKFYIILTIVLTFIITVRLWTTGSISLIVIGCLSFPLLLLTAFIILPYFLYKKPYKECNKLSKLKKNEDITINKLATNGGILIKETINFSQKFAPEISAIIPQI